MRKYLLTLIGLSALFTGLYGQYSFEGTWNMTEFIQETREKKQVYTREEIEADSVFWKISFKSDSTYSQTSNYNATKRVVTYTGTWELKSENRLVMMQYQNGKTLPLKFFWDFQAENMLILERYDPNRTIMLKITFEK